MKIMILSLNHYVGGSEQHAIQLYKALTKYTKFKVRHVVLTLSGKPKKGAFKNKYMEYLPMSPKSKRFKDTSKEIAWADVVQLSDMGHWEIDRQWAKKYGMSDMPPYFELLSAAGEKNPKQKVVGTWHSSPEYLEKNVYPYCRFLADCCDRMYAIRKNIAKRMDCKYLTHMIEPLICFPKLLRKKSRKNLAVSTSRCISVKGQMYIVRAAKKIKGHVLVAGAGNTRYTWQLKQELEKLKPDNIALAGEFKPSKLKHMLIPAKALFNLTKLEGDTGGTEYTILEAIKYGVIPIVDNDWEMPYFTYNNVNRKDPKEIAKSVNRIFKGDYYEDVVKQNYNLLCKHYASSKVIKKYVSWYRGLFVKRKAVDLPTIVKHIKTKGNVKKTRLVLPIDEFKKHYRKSKVVHIYYNGCKIRLKYFVINGKMFIDAWETRKEKK